MTDIQAALGISQLDSLNSFLTLRHHKANYYIHALGNLPLNFQVIPDHIFSSYHLFVVRFDKGFPVSQSDAFAYLKRCGIGVNLHYIPVYLQPFYKSLGFEPGYCPNAEDYFKSCASLPLFPSLETYQQDKVIESITNLYQL